MTNAQQCVLALCLATAATALPVSVATATIARAHITGADHEERAVRYRQKADDLRTIIPDMSDRQTRETLANIAHGYDQLARVQDSLARVDDAIRTARISN